ncbi:MAG TPA: dihydrolipoamide acetyltransferase family protein [Bryobacteraceae bacterium]|nr:dihydrolipoamide acetyltransferase family protein [Bryobacteraceae bacterium]
MIDVEMPQMGESIIEGTLTKWLKKPGDKVERDEPLFEISTDKVDTEIPSPAAGTLAEILVEEGKTVGINTIVGRISDGATAPSTGPAPVAAATAPAAAAAAPAAPAVSAAPAPPAPPAAAPPAESGTVVEETAGPLSPLVRKMARENNIDLSKVKGTGIGGRITKLDLETYLSGSTGTAVAAVPVATPVPQAAPKVVAPAPVAAPAPPPPPPASSLAPSSAPAAMAGAPAAMRVEPMSMMRQKIAEHMVFSRNTSVHVTTVHKTDMTKVAKLRDKLKGAFQAQYGFGLTFLPFVARAAVAALREFPIVNASIEGTNIIYHRDINLGIAVALENGLIVPVIRNADEKNIVGLQRSIVDLAARARSRQLRPEEVSGGTFSITNFGSFGSIFATPVINQPQVAILGVGAVQKEPVVIEDAIAIRSTAYLALTFDHRLIDGALADQFTAKVKSILENWTEEVM